MVKILKTKKRTTIVLDKEIRKHLSQIKYEKELKTIQAVIVYLINLHISTKK